MDWLGVGLGAGSAVSGIANSLINYQSQRENRQMQIDLMREQNAFTREMYNRQLRDNSPSSQMQKLSAAGLNPALAFSDASSTGLASAPSAPTLQAPEVQFSDVATNAAAAFATLMTGRKDSQEANLMNIDSMTRNAYNLATIDELLSRKGLNDVQKAYLSLQDALLSESFQAQKENFVLANEESRARTAMIKENTLNFAADTALKKSLTALNITENSYKAKILQATISELYSRMAANYSQVDLNSKVGENLLFDNFEKIARSKGLQLDNEQKEKLMPYLVESAKYGVTSERLGTYQQAVDLVNPFNFFGKALGGSGSALIKSIAK